MAKSWIEHLVGSLDEKRAWRKFMKQVNALPEDYRFAFKKILHYFYNFGCDLTMLSGLLELFQENAAQGRPVRQVVGSDVAAFCDELIRVSAVDAAGAREKLNREIFQHFHGDGV